MYLVSLENLGLENAHVFQGSVVIISVYPLDFLHHV